MTAAQRRRLSRMEANAPERQPVPLHEIILEMGKDRNRPDAPWWRHATFEQLKDRNDILGWVARRRMADATSCEHEQR